MTTAGRGNEAVMGRAGGDDAPPSSPRAFGIVVGGVLALLALAPLRHGQPMRPGLLALAVVLVLLGVLRPALLDTPSRLWRSLGDALGRVIGPLVLGIVYYLVVTPVALIRRAGGADPLGLRLDRSRRSYWIARESPPGDMRQQF